MEGIPKQQPLRASITLKDLNMKKIDNALIIMNDLIVIGLRLRM